MDTWSAGLRVLLLLSVANIAPIVLKGMLGEQWNTPVDFGRTFVDGRPLLGRSKTWRGVAAALLAGTVAAPVLGFAPELGALAALLAMVGDALASFVKRRLAIAPSGRAVGLDQVPEALLPLLVLQPLLGLPWPVLAGVVLAFALLETPLAWLSHRFGLKDRPY